MNMHTITERTPDLSHKIECVKARAQRVINEGRAGCAWEGDVIDLHYTPPRKGRPASVHLFCGDIEVAHLHGRGGVHKGRITAQKLRELLEYATEADAVLSGAVVAMKPLRADLDATQAALNAAVVGGNRAGEDLLVAARNGEAIAQAAEAYRKHCDMREQAARRLEEVSASYNAVLFTTERLLPYIDVARVVP